MRLEGRSAIVTGAARGMGQAYAVALAEEGADVTVFDLRPCDETAAKVEALGRKAVNLAADITSEEAMDEVAAKTIEAFGKIDILVNNAGLLPSLEPRPMLETPRGEFDKMMAVNVWGTYNPIRAVADNMKANKYGKIINVSSTTVYWGAPFAHYTASKGGVVSMTYTLAREFGPFNVCVNNLVLDFTEVESVAENAGDGGDEKMREAVLSQRIFKRVCTAEDVVGSLKFLASGDSDFMTAKSLIIDGGVVPH